MSGITCSECGGSLPTDERLPYMDGDSGRIYAAAFAYHLGESYVFCSQPCKQHWLDDSQEGAALKDGVS